MASLKQICALFPQTFFHSFVTLIFFFFSGKGFFNILKNYVKKGFFNILNYLKSLHDLVDWELVLTVRHLVWLIYEGRKHEEAFWSDLWWIRGTKCCYVSSIFYFLVLVMLVLVKLDLHACHFFSHQIWIKHTTYRAVTNNNTTVELIQPSSEYWRENICPLLAKSFVQFNNISKYLQIRKNI